MGNIAGAYLFPHPPIIVPEVGRGEEKAAKATIDAVKRAAGDISADRPTTVILVSPHAPLFIDYIYVSTLPELSGDLGRFGAPEVRLRFDNNVELALAIAKNAALEGIDAGGLEEVHSARYRINTSLDHGATVPLYFVDREIKGFKLVHMGFSYAPLKTLYKFGVCIQRAVADSGERVVFLASGDLSHRLSEDGPYGYAREGEEFDRLAMDAVRSFSPDKLLDLDMDWLEKAGECGLRSIVIMMGALAGMKVKPEVYSYEGPFGIGYGVARIKVEQDEAKGPDAGKNG